MPELDDHKTDSLFQVGAGRHDFEYEPAAWEQMEGLLNADDAARRRRFLWFLGIAILLLILLFFFGNQYWTSEELKAEPILTEQNKRTELTPPVATPNSMDESDKEEVIDNDQSNANKIISPSTLAPSSTSPGLNNRTLKLRKEVSPNPQKSVIENTSGTNLRSSKIGTESTPSDQSDRLANRTPVEPALQPAENLTSKDLGAQRPTEKRLTPLPQQAIPFLTYEEKLPAIKFLPVVDADESEAKAPLISVGLSAGMVFGSVESAGFGTTRPRFGAKIDYRLGKKFSIGTGAYLNKVYYKADGEDYKAGEEIWTDGIEPESILADCNVLEVPLSLTFFPRGSNKSGLYAATGLTSYFMMKEVFTFDYDSPRDDLIKGWKEENTNKHLLGLGHFNLGYQRKNGQRSAFQIESFIHLPLQGIGHGKVNLITAGASINYTFGLKRKK